MKRYTLIVKPGCAVDEVQQDTSEFFTIKLSHPSVEGIANKYVMQLMADFLSVPAKDILLVGGGRLAIKVIEVDPS